jgi:hypothetical protein
MNNSLTLSIDVMKWSHLSTFSTSNSVSKVEIVAKTNNRNIQSTPNSPGNFNEINKL